ncbi:MAG TPA: selenocysteine-specific translation elongation factor [Solirubrobacteraceae bacterium]|jgi:selenocysteine-specific elongation factor|nr:selenocysteine-specific translation elongation factor [Solirubrobacteraceae bacterium]
MTAPGPLTLGTAGHIDHGKTALVRALTGVDTDRLPEERERGISIALGYAPLTLPSGRRLSLVDVPGHERFVRTMVAGASGIDLYLMVVAADDGVMPQTVEHAAVLRALEVTAGVVAITKADLADPGHAEREARALLPDAGAVVACSAVTGAGVAEVAAALERVAAEVPTRADLADGPLLHIDRSFTVAGIGTVVTGTLWSGTLHVADTLTLLPGRRAVRVRGLQVHDEPRSEARAGQRVAVNLAGARKRDVARGDVLAVAGRVAETTILDCTLALADGARHGERVQVHHGTRDVPGRLSDLGDGLWQLRLERALLAADGDRVVVRRLSPADTLGGGTVLDAAARRHGRRPDVMARLRARAQGLPEPEPEEVPPSRVATIAQAAPDRDTILRVEADLREAGLALFNAVSLDSENARALAALRAEGRAVRISGQLYTHADLVADTQSKIIGLIEATGSVSLAEARDALGSGRKSAQAFLEYLDAQRITRRQADDRRVLRDRAAAGSAP